MVTAHPKFNLLVSNYLITLINPLKKNDLGGKVSVTHLCRFMELLSPTTVLGRREGRQQIFNISQGFHICLIMSYFPVLKQSDIFTNFPLETHSSILFFIFASMLRHFKYKTKNRKSKWESVATPLKTFLTRGGNDASQILKLELCHPKSQFLAFVGHVKRLKIPKKYLEVH